MAADKFEAQWKPVPEPELGWLEHHTVMQNVSIIYNLWQEKNNIYI